MISIEAEERVRAILLDPYDERSNASIAKATGVSHWTVAEIRRMLGLVRTLPLDRHPDAVLLFRKGLPVGAVAVQMKISEEVACAIRRLYYLQKRRVDKTTMCPTCGAVMRPERQCHRLKRVKYPENLQENLRSFYRVASDVVELDKIEVIDNPLFFYLARRAKKAMAQLG